MTLQACDENEACAADMGGEAVAAYDNLFASLAGGPVSFDFPLPSGGVAQRSLSQTDLETAAASYLYSEGARMIFLRALAAASARDDFVLLARVLYDSLYLYPDTLEPEPDPDYSDAGYYAVECNDYDYTPAGQYLQAGDEIDAGLPRFASIFYGDLPCTFWPPDQFDPGRPDPLSAPGIPTLVLAATADPATPIANARRIVERLDDGYLVVETGGPHVIFGWGNTCVDDLVSDFLVAGALPAQRETACEGVVVDEYVPLAPADAADYGDPLEAMVSVDYEIYYLPEYYYWDYTTPTSVGCPYGGTLKFESVDEGESFTLAACAFSDGFVMSGTGLYSYEDESFHLEVTVTGLKDGRLDYLRTGDGSLHVTGEYGGEPVDLTN
jgi:pimeloyl-ACP methyl ester carboxylesterase